MSKMFSTPEACRTLDPNYMTPYLIQAQKAEFIELIKIINEIFKSKGSPINVFDISVGYARIPVILAEIEEIWKCIGKYVGIDISDACLKIAEKNIRIHNLSDRVNILKFDARDLSQLLKSKQRYDLVICTYFTAGDFVPDSYTFDEKTYLDDSEIKSAFQRVFKPAFGLVRPLGELVLGSIYIDNATTVARQREFYENCGMTVITRPDDSFAATKEGFWSQRFTEKRIIDYFDWIKPKDIEFVPLDTYDFAAMVVITKK